MKKALENLALAVTEVNKSLEGDKTNNLIFDVQKVLQKLVLPNGDVADGLIFKTRNINQFGGFDANRVVKENSVKVEALAVSLAHKGNLTPISVNEDRKVVDGQNRIAAIKVHGIDVDLKYFFSVGADIEVVGEINRHNNKWNHQDWLHKYVTLDRPDYVHFKQLADKYGHIMEVSRLKSVFMNGRVEGFRRDIWEDGLYAINRERLPHMIRFLNFLERVQTIGEGINIFGGERNFKKALFDLYTKTKKLDENRLLLKIQYGFSRLNVHVDEKSYYTILSKLYNSRIADNTPKADEVSVDEKTSAEATEKPSGKVTHKQGVLLPN